MTIPRTLRLGEAPVGVPATETGKKRRHSLMNHRNKLAQGIVSTCFQPPNEVTVLFADRMLTFPMSPTTTRGQDQCDDCGEKSTAKVSVI